MDTEGIYSHKMEEDDEIGAQLIEKTYCAIFAESDTKV